MKIFNIFQCDLIVVNILHINQTLKKDVYNLWYNTTLLQSFMVRKGQTTTKILIVLKFMIFTVKIEVNESVFISPCAQMPQQSFCRIMWSNCGGVPVPPDRNWPQAQCKDNKNAHL